MKGLQKTGAALLVMLLVSGCASTNQKSGWFGDWGKCALAGVAIGGAAGALGDSDRGVLGAAVGAAVGAALGLLGVVLLPSASDEGGFLTGLGFQGASWLWPILIPPLGAGVALLATGAAARRTLRRLS